MTCFKWIEYIECTCNRICKIIIICPIHQVIRRISEYLGYANEICLLEEMLSYLVPQWMSEGSIDGFPYTLLSLDTINDFYRLVINILTT